MNESGIDQLVKMANQIAMNMRVWGDDEEVARRTAEHLNKFWTPEMRSQLLAYAEAGGDALSPLVIGRLRRNRD